MRFLFTYLSGKKTHKAKYTIIGLYSRYSCYHATLTSIRTKCLPIKNAKIKTKKDKETF